jgi:hypothetical protein
MVPPMASAATTVMTAAIGAFDFAVVRVGVGGGVLLMM